MAETLSIATEPASRSGVRPTAMLYLVMQAHRPLARGMRVALRELDALAIGRGAENEVSADELRIDDPWMSTAHARLVAAAGRWVVEDGASKNGTLVNGQRVAGSRILADGDVVEMGHTFLLFRDAVPFADAEAAVATAGEGPLATLVPPLARELAQLVRVATSPVSIVLAGATGTGKEVIARAVHDASGRRGRFVAVNCGALPENLVETEVFGYRRGAFSGATEDRPGLVRAADGGTLFLDEVGELPAPAQVAFLRVLQEREVVAVGATRPVPVDLRLVSATHRDVSGTLRRDFAERLAGFSLELPDLRERREDLGGLIAAILRRLAPDAGAVTFELAAVRRLLAYGWPGNIRELERCLGTALALAGASPIGLEHLPEPAAAPEPDRPEGDDARREQLVRLLEAHRGNISAVARELGKAPVQIRRWLERYGLDADSFRR